MAHEPSTKEKNLFAQVVRSYEEKSYKRGLKTADVLLKKAPRYGDAMAMKALILSAQGKTDEAFALAKESLTVSMKSHICWHVYGLLYRSSKNYEEAIKAYKFALRLAPDSSQIQRDLAILQIQMRDYQGYVQSRGAMLAARTNLRQNWTALAVAHHLAGNLAEAERVMSKYEGTVKTKPSRSDYENSEAVMYKNSLMVERGHYERALKHLDKAATHSLDRLAVLEAKALCLAKLGRTEEADQAYRALLDRNSEHPEYYEQLFEASGIAADDVDARKAVYDEYAERYPRCDAAKRLPLDFLQGDAFVDAARKYLTFMLNKGIPSTFANLKHLYTDPFKKDTLLTLATEYLDSDDAASTSPSEGLYYLAQHFNYHLSRDLGKAMEYIDKAIAASPENVDYHMTKARIWKHKGNFSKAAQTMDFARSLDVKDRYINTKAAKYQLRNNENEKALATIGMFTRAETVGGPLADLLDMQCVWYLTEDGEAYARQGNVGMALKRFHAIRNIFDVWQEDQFDFHTFSLRKGQVRAYIDMVRWEDRLREHPFYSRAALDAVALYLEMHDAASDSKANGLDGENGENGNDPQERKKAAKKARKQQQKLEREAAEKAAKQDPNKATTETTAADAKKKDDDPQGLKLAATKEPLAEAMKFVEHLLQFSPEILEVQMVGFDVLLRRNKYIQAMACLNSLVTLDPSNPKVFERVVEFQHVVRPVLPSLPPRIAEVLKAEWSGVAESTDLSKTNDDFLAKHADSPGHVHSAARVRKLLGSADTAACEKQLLAITQMETATWEDAFEALNTLKSWGSTVVGKFELDAKARWPEASRFG